MHTGHDKSSSDTDMEAMSPCCFIVAVSRLAVENVHSLNFQVFMNIQDFGLYTCLDQTAPQVTALQQISHEKVISFSRDTPDQSSSCGVMAVGNHA